MSAKSKKSPHLHIQALFITAAAVLIILIIIFFGADNKINRSNIEYISSFNWRVVEKPCDIAYLTVPNEFDTVFSAYNDIVKEAGFDLSRYKGAHITRYSYTVVNHRDSDSGLIRINIFVHKGKIISADISSLAKDGFIRPLSADSPAD